MKLYLLAVGHISANIYSHASHATCPRKAAPTQQHAFLCIPPLDCRRQWCIHTPWKLNRIQYHITDDSVWCILTPSDDLFIHWNSGAGVPLQRGIQVHGYHVGHRRECRPCSVIQFLHHRARQNCHWNDTSGLKDGEDSDIEMMGLTLLCFDKYTTIWVGKDGGYDMFF